MKYMRPKVNTLKGQNIRQDTDYGIRNFIRLASLRRLHFAGNLENWLILDGEKERVQHLN